MTSKSEISAMIQQLQAAIKKDPSLADSLKKDPIGTMKKQGISGSAAAKIVYEDNGGSLADLGLDEICWCTTCSITASPLSEADLPVIEDKQAWKKLVFQSS